MNEELRITLRIADRMYPLNIKKHQEEGYRKAAQEINTLIRLYEDKYAMKDRQDALAMCAISFASRLLNISINEDNTQNEISKKIENIHFLLDEMLKK